MFGHHFISCWVLVIIINIILTELGRSVWGHLDLDLGTDNLGQDSPIQTSCLVNKKIINGHTVCLWD